MVPEDVMRLKVISALEVAPDASRLVYGIEVSDRARKGYAHTLYEMDPAGGEPRPLTDPEDDCHTPRFSPDGKSLAYLCTSANGKREDARTGLWRRWSSAGVTRPGPKVDVFAWSPDPTQWPSCRPGPTASAGRKPGPQGAGRRLCRGRPRSIVVTRSQISRMARDSSGRGSHL
jgi:dipeptidyl aminopeptidase/acylaminoacyl peptidase